MGTLGFNEDKRMCVMRIVTGIGNIEVEWAAIPF